MESWRDLGIVLAARPHGEAGVVLSLLTRTRGRHAGYVAGGRSSRLRGLLEIGTILDVAWQARAPESLGSYKIEPASDESDASGALCGILSDSARLSALLAACALCDCALPERESHPAMFEGLRALIGILGAETPDDGSQHDIWGAAYVLWEIAFLRELGFSLDLGRCAGGGDAATLAYVSPRTGRAVSRAAGDPYADKLLALPAFLRPDGSGENGIAGVVQGLEMTRCFLERWAFAHHNTGLPDSRHVFENRLRARVLKQESCAP